MRISLDITMSFIQLYPEKMCYKGQKIIRESKYPVTYTLIGIFSKKNNFEISVLMDLGEVGWGDVDWIGLAQDRNRWGALVNSVCLWV
jgi:hypothetical protein